MQRQGGAAQPAVIKPTSAGSFTPLSTLWAPVVKAGAAEAAMGPPAAKRPRSQQEPASIMVRDSLQQAADNAGRAPPAPPGASGRTDFAAFNAQLRAGFVTSSASATQGRAAPALPSFADITAPHMAGAGAAGSATLTAAATAASNGHVTDALRNISKGFAPAAAGQAPAGERTGADNAAAAPPPQADLRGCTTPPLDWSIKRCVTFTSQQPFQLCQSAVCCSTSDACAALGGATASDSGAAASTQQEQYHAALLSWRHPETAWEGPALSALAGSRSTAPLLSQRLAAWRAAFRSLYHALRHGTCSAFYLLHAEQGRSPATVLFCAPGMRGCDTLHAVLSASSKHLRNKLTDRGLDFTCCGAAAAAGLGGAQQPAQVKDHSPASALLFQGPAAVNGLFDHLYNEVAFQRPLLDEPADLPLLLAPVPFEGAALHKQHVRAFGMLQVPAGPNAPATGAVHKAELRGAVPPWTLQRLCAVLAAGHGHDFSVLLDVEPSTAGINHASSAGSAAAPVALAAARVGLLKPTMARGGALRLEELQQWTEPQQQLRAEVVRAMAYSSASNAYDISTM